MLLSPLPLALYVGALCLPAAGADAESWQPSLQTPAPPSAETAPAAVPLERRLLASASAGTGAAASLLLSLPLLVPLVYLAPLVGISPALGALGVAAAVPVFVAVGSAVASRPFHEGVGPYAVGASAALVAGLTTLMIGVALSPIAPDQSQPAFHVGVLSLVGVPTLAAAATAMVVAPFFVAPAGVAAEIE